MMTGMFWFDQETSHPIQERIFKAALYFQEKFGIPPTVCYLNPAGMSDASMEDVNIEVLYNGNIQSDHLWLGVKEESLNG